jgi:hypothetical protein
MRSADTTAVIAAALREDDQRLSEILGQLDIEEVARLVDAGRFIERRGARILSKRLVATTRQGDAR